MKIRKIAIGIIIALMLLGSLNLSTTKVNAFHMGGSDIPGSGSGDGNVQLAWRRIDIRNQTSVSAITNELVRILAIGGCTPANQPSCEAGVREHARQFLGGAMAQACSASSYIWVLANMHGTWATMNWHSVPNTSTRLTLSDPTHGLVGLRPYGNNLASSFNAHLGRPLNTSTWDSPHGTTAICSDLFREPPGPQTCTLRAQRYIRDTATSTTREETETVTRILSTRTVVNPETSRSNFANEFGTNHNVTRNILNLNTNWNAIVSASNNANNVAYSDVPWTANMQNAFGAGGVTRVTREVQRGNFRRDTVVTTPIRTRQRRIRIYLNECSRSDVPNANFNNNWSPTPGSSAVGYANIHDNILNETPREWNGTGGHAGQWSPSGNGFNIEVEIGERFSARSVIPEDHLTWLNGAQGRTEGPETRDHTIIRPTDNQVWWDIVDHYQLINTTCNRTGIAQVTNALNDQSVLQGTRVTNVSYDTNANAFGSGTLLTGRFTHANFSNRPFGRTSHPNTVLASTANNAFYTQTAGCEGDPGGGGNWGLICPVTALSGTAANNASGNRLQAGRINTNRGWGAQSDGVTSDTFQYVRDNEWNNIRFDVWYPNLSNTSQRDIQVDPAAAAHQSRLSLLSGGTPVEMRWNFGGTEHGTSGSTANVVASGSHNTFNIRAPWASEENRPHRFSMAWRYNAGALSTRITQTNANVSVNRSGSVRTDVDVYCQSEMNRTSNRPAIVRRRNTDGSRSTFPAPLGNGANNWLDVNFNRGVSE